MRKAIKSPLTQRAFELMLEKLTKLSSGVDYKKIKILNNSIMSNWKGIFALKEETKRPQDMTVEEKIKAAGAMLEEEGLGSIW